MRDFANDIHIKRVLSPVATPADNTAQVGQIIDRLGYDSLTYIIATGAIPDADATFAVLLEESDDSGMAGANTVANADMVSQTAGTVPLTAAGFKFDSDDQVRKLGYVGNKRYTRITVTPALNAGATLIAAVAILGHPSVAPVVQTAA